MSNGHQNTQVTPKISSKLSTDKTQWLYSPESETSRILHTAQGIATGFYLVNGFVVVPDTYKGDITELVVFPKLNYMSVPKFWEQVRRIDINNIPVIPPEELFINTNNLVLAHGLHEPEYADLQKTWAQAEDSVLEEIAYLLPGLKHSIENIYIYPTKYGTLASFNRPTDFPSDIHIHLREDADLYALVSAILISITRSKVETEYKGLWSESQMIVDWLIGETPLNSVLKEFQPKRKIPPYLVTLREFSDKSAITESEKFYKELGVRRTDSTFEIKSEKAFVDNQEIRGLTPKEFQLLQLLISHKGEIVTINNIADVLFHHDSDFSLYAISKNIERLRKKLEFNGVTGSYIRTVRGEGYLLR